MQERGIGVTGQWRQASWFKERQHTLLILCNNLKRSNTGNWTETQQLREVLRWPSHSGRRRNATLVGRVADFSWRGQESPSSDFSAMTEGVREALSFVCIKKELI